MVEVAAHLSDAVLPPLPVRQRVFSLPKRLRRFLPRDPPSPPPSSTDSAAGPPFASAARSRWARLSARVYEVFPLCCPDCGAEMRILSPSSPIASPWPASSATSGCLPPLHR
jgi:hypothetical protein